MRNLLVVAVFLFLSPLLSDAQADTLALQKLERLARMNYGRNLDSSQIYARQIIASDAWQTAPESHAFALNWLGITHMARGAADSAENYYAQAIGYAEQQNLPEFEGKAWLNRSINLFQQGEYDRAARHAETSMLNFQEAGDSLGEAHAAYNLGNTLFRLKRYPEARTMYSAAEAIYNEKGSALNRANLYNALGSLFREAYDVDSAAYYFHVAIDIKTSVGGADYCGSELNNLGNIWRDKSRTDSALFYYDKAQTAASRRGDRRVAATAALNLSQMYHLTGQADSALAYGHQTRTLAQATEDDFLLYQAHRALAQAHALNARYDSAFHYQVAFATLKDSVNNLEIQERVSALEKRYRVAEAERNLIQKEYLVQTGLLTIQRQIALIILLILAVVALLLWYRRRIRNQKNAARLAMNQERNRIGMDLHDHLGAELTLISAKLDLRIYQTENQKELAELTAIADQIRATNATLRETVWSIQQESITVQELLDKVESFARKLLAGSAVRYVGKADAPHQILLPQQALTLFRVCQEGINNAFKYARAAQISLDIAAQGGKLNLVLADDGQGFDQEAVTAGFGLQNMKQRVGALGGDFKLEAAPGSGTKIRVVLAQMNS